MEHKPSVQDDLAAIRSLMMSSQRLVRGTWSHQLIWGCLVTVGLVSTWLIERTGRFDLLTGIWIAVLVAGWTFSVVRSRGVESAPPARNVATRAFGGIWIGLGVTLTILGLATIPTGAVAPDGLPGVIATVLGAGYFASGFLAGIWWMSAVGVGWWVGGGLLLIWQGSHALLVLAALTVALEILPALALRAMEAGSADGA